MDNTSPDPVAAPGGSREEPGPRRRVTSESAESSVDPQEEDADYSAEVALVSRMIRALDDELAARGEGDERTALACTVIERDLALSRAAQVDGLLATPLNAASLSRSCPGQTAS
eukprot:m51a1_g149 hypothetical protein (114) ;mRNA; f:474157-474498